MSVDFYSPSIFETNNARHKTPEEVALSFVPPSDIFEELSTKNNHIIVGPRGSGKTTLLKMLTLPALTNWPAQGPVLLPKANFIGIFIPADNGWSVQINDKKVSNISIGSSAFTTHVLMAFVQTLIDLKKVLSDRRDVLENIPKQIDSKQEAELVIKISNAWKIAPDLQNLEGLKLALRKRLIELKDIKKKLLFEKEPERFLLDYVPYITLNFKESISFGIEAYEIISKSQGYSWGMLFDEFEIAPPEIQTEVLASMRGEQDGRLLFKIALAPYNESFIDNFNGQSSVPSHDYKVISLWYHDKKSGANFSEELVKKLISSEGLQGNSLRAFLGTSIFGDEEDSEAYGEDGYVSSAFKQLREIDSEFRSYCYDKDLNKKLAEWRSLPSNEKAAIRKLRSVVITRNNLLKSKPGEDTTQKRSRKNHDLYAGYPTILEICEGNPRTLINLFTPIVRELKTIHAVNAKKKVSSAFQAEQIRYAANSFRSLLKTIEYDNEQGKSTSLLNLLDKIGDYFKEQCLGADFHPEPTLSFIVPSSADEKLIKVLGRALNAGAIIYVPDAKADPIMGSIKGKRFRLNYLLAAYYGLPIMLNASVSLDRIIKRQKVITLNLFSDEESHG